MKSLTELMAEKMASKTCKYKCGDMITIYRTVGAQRKLYRAVVTEIKDDTLSCIYYDYDGDQYHLIDTVPANCIN